MSWKTVLENKEDLLAFHETTAHFTAGFAIGIIADNLVYPKLPGNVANATTYPFPVLYREVDFEIEELFEGNTDIKDQIIEAALYLEKQGVRAIVGACGYFAHFQDDVREAVNVPVFLSSLCQLPLIKTAISSKKNIAVFAASKDNINDELLKKVGSDMDRLVLVDVGSMESFAGIRYGSCSFDNRRLTEDLSRMAKELTESDRSIGAILLECSDLPPYAKAIQAATGLPVFDFNTMIDLLYHSVVQKTYYGYF